MPPLLKDIRRLKNNFDSYSSIGLGPLVTLDLISSKLLALASILHLLYMSDFLNQRGNRFFYGWTVDKKAIPKVMGFGLPR